MSFPDRTGQRHRYRRRISKTATPGSKTMPRIVAGLTVAYLLSVVSAGLAAEPTVVPLWPGKTPQDVGIEGEEYVKIFESPILKGPTRLVTNVTKPSISV